MVALSSVAMGLADVIRELDDSLALTVSVIGILVGWGLATMPLPGWLATILASIFGFGVVFLRVGQLGGKLVALLQMLAGLSANILRWLLDGLSDGPAPDWTPVVPALAELWAGVSTLLGRVRDWSLALAARESAFDPVSVALVWCLTLWAVSAWAGWAVRRRDQPLHGITLAGALLAATLSYAGGRPYILLMLLGATLLLLALTGYDVRVRRWQAAGIDFPNLGSDITRVVIPLSLALVVAAGLAPSLSMRKMIEFVQELGDRRAEEIKMVAESLGIEQQPLRVQETVLDKVRAGGLPRRHLLGSGPELSDRTVMIVSTGDLPPGPPEEVMSQPPPRYYWRSLTYDRYAHSGWFTGGTETVEYGAGEPAVAATLATQRTVRQEVQVVGYLGDLLHVAGTLVAVDQSYQVAWRSPGDALGATIEATTYRADSLVPVISEEQLRSAGSDYPEWVQSRYLALPDTVPARVLSLARDLTAIEPTPYDRARAIETYLRAFRYTLDVPAPPPDQDVVDYFLFDLQEGYCDYYATAMVVLARAAGLPARLVVGYATGRYDPVNAHYVVAEDNAHTWVEVYFPGYEWVEFEPTGGFPSIKHSVEASSFEWSEPEGRLEPAVAGWDVPGWVWWLGLPGGLALVALAGIVWSAADRWWLRHREPVAAVAILYRRLERHGRRLAVPSQVGDTPYEFAASLAGWVADLAQRGRWSGVLTSAVQEVRQLTELYVQASYSSRLPGAADRTRAIQTWQGLRWRLWLARMWQKKLVDVSDKSDVAGGA